MLFDDLMSGVIVWGVMLAMLGIVLLSLEMGYRLGRYRHRCSDREKEAPVSQIVAATLGLLAFLLAFTFSLAASRFEIRRQLALKEANAIGTAWLRAGLLPEPEHIASRALLHDYVVVRLTGARTEDLTTAIRESEALHQKLWTHAEQAVQLNDSMVRTGLYIQALNDVIDTHSERIILSARNRIPAIIWIALLGETVLAMAVMGYHAGLTGTTRSLASLVIALAFSGVIVLIVDLDNPSKGLIQTSQQALIDVQAMMDSH